MKDNDKNNVAFAYSLNLLRTLLAMNLITNAEFDTIVHISAKHYNIEVFYF